MLNLLRKWLKVEKAPCESCETLKLCFAQEKEEKKQLLQLIIDMQKPAAVETVRPPSADLKPIAQFTPWRVRQQMLEREDAAKAKLMKEKDEEQKEIDRLKKELDSTDSLEEALGIGDAPKSGTE